VTCVKSCEPGKLEQLVNGKKTSVEGFEVELDDTVLFPEGGGQVFLFLLNVISVSHHLKKLSAPVRVKQHRAHNHLDD
jgi:hypothetical protein